jgi:hypothetical protein
MEDTKRKSDRVLKVERGFEWSRLEGQMIASAYERVLPIIRAGPSVLPGESPEPGSERRIRTTQQEWAYATGA